MSLLDLLFQLCTKAVLVLQTLLLSVAVSFDAESA